MDFETWLDDLTGHATRRDIAGKTGHSATTLTRQLDRGVIRPEMVIALCRAYGRSPATGLVETGYLYAYELEASGVAAALRSATNQQLLDEILRRSDPEAMRLFSANGDDDVVDLVDDAQVIEFDPARDVASSHDQDALRYGGADDEPL